MALGRNDIVRHFVGRFCDVGAELMGERVGIVLFVVCVVSIDSHCAVEIDRIQASLHQLRLAA